MRKRTTAGIALGGAAVLLMGGLGSTALWTDAAPSSDVSISTGYLTISDGTASGGWTDVSVTPNVAFDPETDHLVPGDRVRSTTGFTIDARGKNLRADLSFSTGTSLPPGLTVRPVEITLDRDGAGSLPAEDFDDPAEVTIQEGDAQKLAVTFEIAFKPGATGSQDQPVDVSNVRAILTQARPN